MINQDIIAQDLFYKIRSRFPKMEMGDDKGQPTFEATKGRFFDFDAIFEGHNLGTVSISINEPGSLKIYFSKNILEDVDEYVSKTWFSFLREMRKFAMKRLMSFDTRDISKTNLDKRDYGYLAKKESIMNESMMKGTSRTSYKPLEKTRLIIRHTKPVDESIPGARSRNIQSLFIENAAGERFKYPFVHKSGAEAMQRHVANGGVPHDPIGQQIIEMSEQIAQLSSFKQYVQREDLMNSETNHIVDRAAAKLENLKETVKKISRQHHYEAFKNQIESGLSNSDQQLIDDITIQEYKDKFTVKSFKEDIANVFPLLYRIMQEESELNLEEYVSEEKCSKCDCNPCECEEEVKEDAFSAFTEWADTLTETKLTPEEIDSLRDMMSERFPVGVNGENVSSSLENLGIDLPEDSKIQLAQLAEEQGPDADAVELVREILSKHEPEIYEMLGIEPAQVEELDTPPAKSKYDQFMDKRSADDRPGTKYYVNGREVTGAEMDQSKQTQQANRSPMELELDDFAAQARQRAADRKAGKNPMENAGMMSNDDRKAANEYVRKVSAGIKSGEINPEEIKKDFYYTLEMYGVDDDKIMSAWQRVSGEGYEPLTKRSSVSDADIDAELKGIGNTDDDDDDMAFLANLKNKAKSGAVKQDTTGFGAGLDETSQENSSKKIAEFIMSFYDKENGTFPLGETGVKIKVEKQFGERAAQLAEKLIQQMAVAREERDAFEELKMLSGMKKPAEGNKFTGNLMKARAAGDKEADLDGDGDMEPVIKSEAQEIDFSDIKRLAGVK
jgi:hypothetical protein